MSDESLELKKAYAEIDNLKMRLSLLSGSLKIGLWDRYVNPDQEYDDSKAKIWWSDEFRHLLGYTDENDFPNEIGSWVDSIHPDDRKMTVDAMSAFLNDKTGKTPYGVENRMKLKTGEYRWFRSFGSAIRDKDGNPIRAAGATVDITERKKTERMLEEKNELQFAMFQNAPVGLTIFDDNYKFIDCNENILKMFGGITREEYAQIFGSDEHSPEFQPDGTKSFDKAMEIVIRVIHNGEKMKTEFVHKLPGGGLLPVELTLSRIKQGNKYVGLAYIYDMTQQDRLKKEIEKALQEAEHANKAKSYFLAKMSHEIRTPMNAILGITELQLQSGLLKPETEEALSRIYESGNLLMGIINDILDLSKIEAEKLEIIPVKYDVPSLINDTVQLNRLRNDSKPIELSINLDENTPHGLIGDELRIKQILNNILSNAYKYTKEGSIDFSIYTEPADVATHGDNDIILIFTVRDTGQGMTEEQLKYLFAEYTRFNEEANRTTVGTGLGMSITKHLVGMMGGDISVESKVNKGTVFTVRIPQKRHGTQICGAQLADKLGKAEFQSRAIRTKAQFVREYMPYGSVLVVDDVDSNIYVAEGLLLPYGLHIETADSGFAAIDNVKAGKKYDIIFMDHMMPQMDGIEATRIIRETGYDNPIIALTANALVGQAEEFIKNGFDGYISKPIDSRELNHVLNDFIRNRKPPEVIEAARHEQALRNKKHDEKEETDAQSELRRLRLSKYIIVDANNTIKVLENLYKSIDNWDDASLELFTVTVHGMKGALANTDENILCDAAFRLEKAGVNRDFDIIKTEGPVFIKSMYTLVEKLENQINNAQIATSGESTELLREKLPELISACKSYNANTARTVLDKLRTVKWNTETNEKLEEISMLLLHSSFKKAAETANSLLEM